MTFFAAQFIGGRAENQLQGSLSQSINAHGQTHQGRIGPARVFGSFDGKNGQHHKQAQHPQGVNGRQREARTLFKAGHERVSTAVRRRHCRVGNWGRGYMHKGYSEP